MHYKDGTKEIRLDFADLVILRWFVDYYPKMKKYNINDEQYGLVVYSKVLSDLPLLNINKRAIADRFQKLCHFKILKYELIKNKGNYTSFTFGDNYINLIDSCLTDKGMLVNQQRVCWSTNKGVAVQPTDKDKSINCKEIINLYNSICISLTRVVKLSSSRERAIKARLNSGYTLDDFKTCFENAEASDFLCGQNDKGWKADFDWLISDTNICKVIEGKYSQTRTSTKQSAHDKSMDIIKDLYYQYKEEDDNDGT